MRDDETVLAASAKKTPRSLNCASREQVGTESQALVWFVQATATVRIVVSRQGVEPGKHTSHHGRVVANVVVVVIIGEFLGRVLLFAADLRHGPRTAFGFGLKAVAHLVAGNFVADTFPNVAIFGLFEKFALAFFLDPIHNVL